MATKKPRQTGNAILDKLIMERRFGDHTARLVADGVINAALKVEVD
jgi:hypothetical protein